MTTTDQTFEDRLLRELRAVVSANPAPAPAPPAHQRVTRPRLALAGAVAAAAVAATVVISSGDQAAPAYAVESHPDGSVSVTIKSLRDAPGLERKLRAAGIPAVVDYLPAGKACREPRFKQARPATGAGLRQGMRTGVRTDGSGTTFEIAPGQLRPGQTLVIQSSLGDGLSTVGTQIAQGPVGPCHAVDAPGVIPPPAPGGKTTGGAQGHSESFGGPDTGPSTHVGP